MTLYRQLKVSRDMGHELFNNMREGNWLLEYHRDRLSFMKDDLAPVTDYFDECLKHVKRLSKALRPKYGSRVIEKLYNAAVYEVL